MKNNITFILTTIIIIETILLAISIEFNLMNSFEITIYQGREQVYRDIIQNYNPKDKILDLNLVKANHVR